MDVLAFAATCAPAVHPDTLARMVRVESGGHPWAIGVNGGRLVRQPVSLAEAVATARDLRRRGLNFDAGPLQINVRNWAWLGLDELTVFDPCANLRAAQAVLLDCWSRAPSRDSQAALRQSFSCFNSGNHRRGFLNGYVAKVVWAPAAFPVATSTKERRP